MVKLVFLIGHRKQMGKDTTCDLAEAFLNENDISFIRTSFAAKLKKHCAERYDLDVGQMEFDEYKKSKPSHLNGLSVRDVLIAEGNFARKIWDNVWTFSAWNDIFNSTDEVALVSDFRYPNEYECIQGEYKLWASKNSNVVRSCPKIVKVLVHREKGSFNNDGSDDQLPDLDANYWDEVILNNIEGLDWRDNMKKQVHAMIQKNLKNLV